MNKSSCIYTLREWESFTVNDIALDNNQEVAEKDFQDLRELSKLDRLEANIFSYDHWRKRLRLINNKVGIISLPSGSTLEVIPKIGDEAGARKLLIDMILIYWKAKKIIPREFQSSTDLFQKQPQEILISLFLKQCSILVRRGLAREYHDYEETLPYIRGKIDFNKQSIKSVSIPIHLKFQEYEENRAENRLIKSCLIKVNRITKIAENMLLAEKLLLHFENVAISDEIQADFGQWKRKSGRDLFHYRKIKPLVELILQDKVSSPIRSKKNTVPFSLLFSMDELFELFIEFHARKHRIKIEVQKSYQKFIKYGVKEFFSLKPDFLFPLSDGVKIIGDAKWKIIDIDANSTEENKKNYFGISREDLYQLFAYINFYGKELKKGILIYPKTERFKEIREFEYVNDNEKLYLFPFDCFEPERSVLEISNLLKLSVSC